MNQVSKLIKSKLGLLTLAEHLGNVSQACKVMGCRTASTDAKKCTTRDEAALQKNWLDA